MDNKIIYRLVETFLETYPEAEKRGGHLVFSDDNYCNNAIQHSVNALGMDFDENNNIKTEPEKELDKITTYFLFSLLQFPEELRS